MDAAIRVADAEGLAAVSMRRIATEIGAGAMSLYTYVPDKERLIDLMVDAVRAETEPAPTTGDWRADLLAPTGLDGPTKLEVIALLTGFVASFVTAELAGTTPTAEQVALIGEVVAGGDFPHLAAALAAATPARAPTFDRLAAWMIAGLVDQAQAGWRA